MDTYEIASCVRGHHVYKRVWRPVLGEEVKCQIEEGNVEDRYAVAVLKENIVVGHIPRKISAACYLFIKRNGSISCVITGKRQYSIDLPQGGLDVPCLLRFRGVSDNVAKIKKLLARYVYEPETTLEQPHKKRKFDSVELDETVTEEEKSPGLWITYDCIDLTLEDKEIITSGNWMTDKHMNFAQGLLKKQNRDISGLQFTFLLPTLTTTITSSRALQIMHCRGNHWIVTTTIGCPQGVVKVFDSLYSSVDPTTQQVILKHFGAGIKIMVEEGPKQVGVKDCGVFAIATATLLANGGNPSSVIYKQQCMREHLLKCFEDSHLVSFPVETIQTIGNVRKF